jgi:hypothetical protein
MNFIESLSRDHGIRHHRKSKSSNHQKHKKEFTRMIPAYHFKAKSSGDGIIQDYVNDILRIIEDDMKQAIEDDKTNTKTEVSCYFNVPGMENTRAQLHIYYHVIKALRRAGYIPRIEIIKDKNQNKKVFVLTTWLTKEDNEMENHMFNYILKHKVKKKEDPQEIKPISRRRRKVV